VAFRGVVLEKPQLIAEVPGDEIVVRTLGFCAAYAKPSDTPQLVLRRRTETDDHEPLSSSLAGGERQGARARVDCVDKQKPRFCRGLRRRSWAILQKAGGALVRLRPWVKYEKRPCAGFLSAESEVLGLAASALATTCSSAAGHAPRRHADLLHHKGRAPNASEALRRGELFTLRLGLPVKSPTHWP
jgi:hypothetical protein